MGVIEEYRDDKGRAWIAWTYDGYAASLQGGTTDPMIYDEGIGPIKDDGITPVALSEALAWALARTDRVIVRPRWTRVSTIGLVAVRCPTILRLTKMRCLF